MHSAIYLDNELIVFLRFRLIILVAGLYLIGHQFIFVIRSVNISEPVVQRRTRCCFAIVHRGL